MNRLCRLIESSQYWLQTHRTRAAIELALCDSVEITLEERQEQWKSLVKPVAERLWRLAGEPESECEKYWYEAEDILRADLDAELILSAREMSAQYQLGARVWHEIKTVAVKGDERAYEPVVEVFGVFPGHDLLAELSTQMTNRLKVSRVVFTLTR